jgi:hypothetical protein
MKRDREKPKVGSLVRRVEQNGGDDAYRSEKTYGYAPG